MTRTVKILISLFIILNISTILFMNRPLFLIATCEQTINKYNSPQFAYKLNYIAWLIKRYAHLVGLDNKWMMFGRQTRFNWHYIIKAKYKNSKEVLLPLEMQTPRTFLQKEFIDFKEAKFHLNIYAREFQRETYARYLCRMFSMLDNSPIEKIIYELHWQNIYTPEQAKVLKKIHYPESYHEIVNKFTCPTAAGVKK